MLTCTTHATAAGGLRAETAAREFAAHAEMELEHAKMLIRRLETLGGPGALSG